MNGLSNAARSPAPALLPALAMASAMAIAMAACSSGGGGSGSNNAIVQSTGGGMQPALAASGQGCTQLSRLPEGGITAVDNSRTPAADVNAERLAREASSDFVADNAVYTRVIADLAALRSAFPNRTTASSSGCYQENQLLVQLTDEAEAQRQAGNYSDWNDFNNKLRLTNDEAGAFGIRRLTFNGNYNMARAAEQYEALSGVEFAESNGFAGDGNDVCLEIRGSDYLYIFNTGSGDCPSGCINHQYEGFSIDTDGNITDLGSHSSSSNQPQPGWFADAQNCRAYL